MIVLTAFIGLRVYASHDVVPCLTEESNPPFDDSNRGISAIVMFVLNQPRKGLIKSLIPSIRREPFQNTASGSAQWIIQHAIRPFPLLTSDFVSAVTVTVTAVN